DSIMLRLQRGLLLGLGAVAGKADLPQRLLDLVPVGLVVEELVEAAAQLGQLGLERGEQLGAGLVAPWPQPEPTPLGRGDQHTSEEGQGVALAVHGRKALYVPAGSRRTVE